MRRPEGNKESNVIDSWRRCGFVLGACLLSVAGCSAGLSPAETVLGTTRTEFTDQDHFDARIAAPGDSPVLITVSSRDVDVRVATPSLCDAPNRRMGIESLLLEPPHAPTITVRIDRNDHKEARGLVTVDAVALPVITEADHKRIDAVRLESPAR